MVAAAITGITGLVGKFITDPDERDVVLPWTALLVGVVGYCYFFGWNIESALDGIVLGATTTGLYAVPKAMLNSDREVRVK